MLHPPTIQHRSLGFRFFVATESGQIGGWGVTGASSFIPAITACWRRSAGSASIRRHGRPRLSGTDRERRAEACGRPVGEAALTSIHEPILNGPGLRRAVIAKAADSGPEVASGCGVIWFGRHMPSGHCDRSSTSRSSSSDHEQNKSAARDLILPLLVRQPFALRPCVTSLQGHPNCLDGVGVLVASPSGCMRWLLQGRFSQPDNWTRHPPALHVASTCKR
jgi:hypothetical protein